MTGKCYISANHGFVTRFQLKAHICELSPRNLWQSLNKRVWEYWRLTVSCFQQIHEPYSM